MSQDFSTYTRRVRGLACVGAATVACVLVSSAAAEKGVHPDPNSPAGVEYQLPLERARQDAAGNEPAGSAAASAETRGGGKTPLFGAGVERSMRGATQDSDTSKDAGGARSAAGAALPAVRADAAEASATSDVGPSILIVLGVLLVGGIAGFGLRRVWQ